jgi:hypothetical protein
MLQRVALVRTDVSEERVILQEPHYVTSQKTPLFTVTEVRRTIALNATVLALTSSRGSRLVPSPAVLRGDMFSQTCSDFQGSSRRRVREESSRHPIL